jgi:hypothetical protein
VLTTLFPLLFPSPCFVQHGHECYPSLINHHVSSLSYVSSTTHDLSDDWDSDYDDDEEAEADARKRAMKADYSAASAAAAARAQKLAREDQKVDRDWLHMLDLMLELVSPSSTSCLFDWLGSDGWPKSSMACYAAFNVCKLVLIRLT